MDYISINGQLTPYDHARIAPGDSGFLHGAGLFETMRARNSRIFRLSDHLTRLEDSARTLGISLSLTAEQLQEMADDLLEASHLTGPQTDARLRLTITRGDPHQADAENPVPPITLVLSAVPFGSYPGELYEKGMTVVIASAKQNPQNPLTGHKTTSYLDRLLALREAQGAGAGEALWFTPNNETLAEGSISNIFLVDQSNTLLTPPLSVAHAPSSAAEASGPASTSSLQHSAFSVQPSALRLCLAGITRKLVLNLAIEQNLLPHERLLTINDLLSAKEVFLTNAIMGVMPVTRIERHAIADEKPGPLTLKLREGYSHTIAAECA